MYVKENIISTIISVSNGGQLPAGGTGSVAAKAQEPLLFAALVACLCSSEWQWAQKSSWVPNRC